MKPLIKLSALIVVPFLLGSPALFAEASGAETRDQAYEQQEGSRPPPRHGGKPPEPAISACLEQAAGAVCEFEGRRQEVVTGVCKFTPDEKYFACKPARDRRPPMQSSESEQNRE